MGDSGLLDRAASGVGRRGFAYASKELQCFIGDEAHAEQIVEASSYEVSLKTSSVAL